MRYISMLALAVIALALPAHADDRLGTKSFGELQSYTTAPASGDYTYMYDVSANRIKKVPADTYAAPTMSTTYNKNPFVQSTYDTMTSTEFNTGQTVISSAASKVIRVLGAQVKSTGNMAGVTTAIIECSGGLDIMSIPVALLTNGTVIGEYTSGVTYSSTAVDGCPAGNAVQIGKTGGTASTATALDYTINYVWQ